MFLVSRSEIRGDPRLTVQIRIRARRRNYDSIINKLIRNHFTQRCLRSSWPACRLDSRLAPLYERPSGQRARRSGSRMIIAIDGPAASGKGTIARRIAAHYRLPHLDTGLLYRATAAALIAEVRDLYDEAAAVAIARGLGLTDFNDATLRTRQMGEAASVVAAMPRVRAALIEAQRAFAARPGGAVLDGRDIGTVICPEAEVKIFVTASAAARAQRRALELSQRGERADYNAILADIIRRDARDSNRSVAPLRPADDATTLDTTHLGIGAAAAEALRIVEAARIRV